MKKILLTTVAAATLLSTQAMAQDHSAMDHSQMDHSMHNMTMAGNMHHGGVNIAPNGVMGDHLHAKGDWMVSYNFMQMNMEDNRNGTNDLSLTDVLTFPNANAGPANLRVVPTKMTMDMHMLGGMVGVTDSITVMVMANYLNNEMDHVTYNMAGNAEVGRFTTNSKGFGDTQVAALFSLWEQGSHKLNGQIGLSLPTGSIEEEDSVLTPMNTRPTLRMPYAMQLGSGTYDVMPGLTYTGQSGDWSYGTAYSARIHTGRNDEGYTRGNWHALNSWVGYHFTPAFGLSMNVKAKTEADIDGKDTQIAAPVQSADPKNYGGEKIHLGFNVGYKFAGENTIKTSVELPVYQNLNGPQLQDDYNFAVRFQRGF